MAAEGLPMSTPASMAAMGPDWYQSGPGLVIDFSTSPGRTGNSTYQLNNTYKQYKYSTDLAKHN